MKHLTILTSLFVFLMLTCYQLAWAQNASEDFKQINQAYLEQDQLELNLTYQLFDSWESQTPMQTEQGLVKKDGIQLFFQLGEIVNIQNKQYSLSIDHEDHSMLIQDKPDQNAIAFDEAVIQVNLEATLKACEKVKYSKINNRLAAYDLAFPEHSSEFAKARFVYNTSNYLLEKIVLYYNDTNALSEEQEAASMAPRVEIDYTKINTQPSFGVNDFTYDPYLQKQGKELVAKAPYNDYTLYK